VVRFFDISGRELKSAELEGASNILNLEHLISGPYIYSVYDADENVFTGQVIVIR
jgi:hypothetical protein